MRHIKTFIAKLIHGYTIPPIIKAKELVIKPTDKLCILSPHADDETIGTGGLLALYGSQTDVILLTDGSKGGDRTKPEKTKKIRNQEFINVMNYFKINRYQFMEANDGNLIMAYDKFQTLDFSNYDYIFMPHTLDGHKDHIAVSALYHRLKAKKHYKATIAYYEVWQPMSQPTHYLDITKVHNAKKEAMDLYISQKNINYAERILGLNYYRGIKHHTDYVESYTLER